MRRLLPILCAAVGLPVLVTAAEQPVATEAEIRARQNLGRVVIAPDGSSFAYEWMRPYGWARDTRSIPQAAASRMQTWLYRVSVTGETIEARYAFFPSPTASYWLGSYSPNGSALSFYMLDNGSGALKVAAALFAESGNARVIAFDRAPEPARLEQPPVWISSEELVYVTPGGTRIIGNISSGETRPCEDCDKLVAKLASSKSPEKSTEKPPAGSRELARSESGELRIYERSDARGLELFFRKGSEGPETLVFRNERQLAAWPPETP